MVAIPAISLPIGSNRVLPLFGGQSGTKPKPRGSKIQIWKQDPSVDAIGIRASYLHTPVQSGPQDDVVVIRRMPVVKPDADGNFMVDREKNPKEFDAVHTFGVVRQVFTMFERAMKRMGLSQELKWQWGDAPINVYPHAGNMANAYYSRSQQAMRFFHFKPPSGGKDQVYTARSFDIVSHETGHAILDGLRPGYLSSWNPQTGGLHESFGDLSAIFTMLSQLDQCEAIIAESKTNLHNKTFFSALAEEFGAALGRPMGLRNADNDLKMSDVSNQVHDISQVFTGTVYDILADIFEDSLRLDREDPAFTLFKTGDHLNAVLIGALLEGPEQNATYKDIAEKMMGLESNPRWRKFMEKRFTEREILGPKAAPSTEVPSRWNWQNTCPTMQRREHKKLVNQAIREARQTIKS